MRTEFLCISVLRVASGARVKLASCKSALGLPFKETIKDILNLLWFCPYTRPKFVNMEICTIRPLNYFVEYIWLHQVRLRSCKTNLSIPRLLLENSVSVQCLHYLHCLLHI